MPTKKALTAILFLFVTLLIASFALDRAANAVADDALAGTKICLDPGHGGSDPGAINPDYGLEESDINLEVAYGLRFLLEGSGADVVMTRTGDQYLDNSDRYTFCNAEQATILISVHTNSHSDLTWDGTMTLYGPRESPELAQTLHNVMYPYLRDTRPSGMPEEEFVDYGIDRYASGVLFKSDMAAAMLEPLLMSNIYEGPLLATSLFDGFAPDNFDYESASISGDCSDFSCRRGQIAWAAYQGTLAYFGAQPVDPPGGEMFVAALTMDSSRRGRNYAIHTAVSILDTAGQPVPGAEVTLRLTQLPDGSPQEQTALTGADGVASFTTKVSSTGLYQAAVLTVSKVGWTYDAASNIEDTKELAIP